MNPAATLSSAEAESSVLREADRLFYNRGIAAVTMANVRDDSGVSMRRLYSMYPSKSDLVLAWLSRRHHEWLSDFKASVARHIGSAKSATDAVFLALEDWMTETDFTGCGFINTHAERSGITAEHRSVIAMHKRSVARYLEELTGAGPAIALLVDGAIVEASIFGHAGPIRTARRIAESLR